MVSVVQGKRKRGGDEPDEAPVPKKTQVVSTKIEDDDTRDVAAANHLWPDSNSDF